MAPTSYTLRHGREDGTDALRNWELQGSIDGKVCICECLAQAHELACDWRVIFPSGLGQHFFAIFPTVNAAAPF